MNQSKNQADPADNAGGGAPSDNTDILRHLIETGVENACLGPLWDPIAVRICFDAGLGARIGLRFGGKIAPSSGQPVDAADRAAGQQLGGTAGGEQLDAQGVQAAGKFDDAGLVRHGQEGGKWVHDQKKFRKCVKLDRAISPF